MVNGNDLQLYLGTTSTRANTSSGAAGERVPIAVAQSVTLDISIADIPTTHKATAGFKTSIPGEIGATLSFSGLLPETFTATADTGTERNLVNIIPLAINRTTLYWEFGLTGNARVVGQGYINAKSLTGGTNDAGGFSGSITVTDTFSFVTDVTT